MRSMLTRRAEASAMCSSRSSLRYTTSAMSLRVPDTSSGTFRGPGLIKTSAFIVESWLKGFISLKKRFLDA